MPALDGARELVVACHEHFDGSPAIRSGLAGEQIPVGARIILACDAYHAMISDRVYRKAMSSREAVAELRRCAGSAVRRRGGGLAGRGDRRDGGRRRS